MGAQMKDIANRFLLLAGGFAALGIGTGAAQAAGVDLNVTASQSNLYLVGLVSMLLYGLYYRFRPPVWSTPLVRMHTWITTGAALTVLLGTALLSYGASPGRGLIVGGAVLLVLAMAAFLMLLVRDAQAE